MTRRRLITLASALSLLLCVATVALRALGDDGFRILRDGGGGIGGGGSVNTYAVFRQDGIVGLGWTRSDVRFEGTIASPLWLLALAAAVLPARWVLRHLNQGPGGGPGLCPRCGYDLRATPARCPECGRATAEMQT